MATGIFYTIWHHAHYINQRELSGRGRPLLRDGLGVGQQVLSNCSVQHLFLSGFIPLSPLFIKITVIIIIAIVISYFISFIKLIFHLFLIFLPSHQRAGNELGAVWYLVISWGDNLEQFSLCFKVWIMVEQDCRMNQLLSHMSL